MNTNHTKNKNIQRTESYPATIQQQLLSFATQNKIDFDTIKKRQSEEDDQKTDFVLMEQMVSKQSDTDYAMVGITESTSVSNEEVINTIQKTCGAEGVKLSIKIREVINELKNNKQKTIISVSNIMDQCGYKRNGRGEHHIGKYKKVQDIIYKLSDAPIAVYKQKKNGTLTRIRLNPFTIRQELLDKKGGKVLGLYVDENTAYGKKTGYIDYPIRAEWLNCNIRWGLTYYTYKKYHNHEWLHRKQLQWALKQKDKKKLSQLHKIDRYDLSIPLDDICVFIFGSQKNKRSVYRYYKQIESALEHLIDIQIFDTGYVDIKQKEIHVSILKNWVDYEEIIKRSLLEAMTVGTKQSIKNGSGLAYKYVLEMVRQPNHLKKKAIIGRFIRGNLFFGEKVEERDYNKNVSLGYWGITGEQQVEAIDIVTEWRIQNLHLTKM